MSVLPLCFLDGSPGHAASLRRLISSLLIFCRGRYSLIAPFKRMLCIYIQIRLVGTRYVNLDAWFRHRDQSPGQLVVDAIAAPAASAD